MDRYISEKRQICQTNSGVATRVCLSWQPLLRLEMLTLMSGAGVEWTQLLIGWIYADLWMWMDWEQWISQLKASSLQNLTCPILQLDGLGVRSSSCKVLCPPNNEPNLPASCRDTCAEECSPGPQQFDINETVKRFASRMHHVGDPLLHQYILMGLTPPRARICICGCTRDHIPVLGNAKTIVNADAISVWPGHNCGKQRQGQTEHSELTVVQLDTLAEAIAAGLKTWYSCKHSRFWFLVGDLSQTVLCRDSHAAVYSCCDMA